MAYRFIDLFCGCGGLSKGFSLAGFDCVGGIDFNQAAINTFNHNFEGAKGICCDLLQMSTEQIIEEFGDISNVDVVIGGPPCQGMSLSGPKSIWLDSKIQGSNHFFNFILDIYSKMCGRFRY